MSMFKRCQNRVFWLLWITYASFYLGRVNFSVALPGIMADYGWSKLDVGIVGTALFWAYAIGQFINGFLGDRFGARSLVMYGLMLSAAMNSLFASTTTLPVLVVIWAVNGYVQSMGWAPTVKTLANWYAPQVRGKMAGRLGTSYILGGALSVALAGFLTANYGWRFAFLVPCALLITSALHWRLSIQTSPEDSGFNPVEHYDCTMQVAARDRYMGWRYALRRSIGSAPVWLMGFGLFFVNILRYGFLTWAPTYLFEVQGAPIDRAAYSSIVFPLAGALGAITSGWATDRWFQSRRAPIAALSLLLAGILAYVYRFAVPIEQWGLGLVVLAAIGFFVFGTHVLVVAAAPMDFGTRKAASTATGFIDGLGYIGAGLQGIGTGWLVERYGWNAGFAFWIVCAMIGAGLISILWKYRPRRQKYL